MYVGEGVSRYAEGKFGSWLSSMRTWYDEYLDTDSGADGAGAK
jgi:hypothetical protein